jgi:hypothetical protein
MSTKCHCLLSVQNKVPQTSNTGLWMHANSLPVSPDTPQSAFTALVDINTQYPPDPPRWRKIVASFDSNASANIMSRKVVSKDLELRINEDTEDDPILVGRALGLKIKLHGWIDIQWASQNSEDMRMTRCLVTVEEDPPFDLVLGSKLETESYCDSEHAQSDINSLENGKQCQHQSASWFATKRNSGRHSGIYRRRWQLWLCFPL